MMGCCTRSSAEAVQWLIDDSPRTPKLLIADAEAHVDRSQIEGKVRAMRAVMEAYYIDVTPVLGLVLGGDLVLHALFKSPETPVITEYAPLEGKDLTVADDVVSAMKEFNTYFHRHSITMTAEMRQSFPITRSRSSSIVSSSPSHSRAHPYSLRLLPHRS